LDILFVVAEANSTLSVSEIAEKVELPESTTYRLLQTLEQNGIIERRGKGRIGLGLKILDLARSLHGQIDSELYTIARPIMESLTEKLNETSLLMVRTGMQVVCIQNVNSRHLLRMAVENGRILPLNKGASGKAILAFETPRIIEQALKSLEDDEAASRLDRELETIRHSGSSVTIGEVDPDVCAIAVPIFDAYRRVIASLSLAGLSNRFKEEAIPGMIETVAEAARQISKKLTSP